MCTSQRGCPGALLSISVCFSGGPWQKESGGLTPHSRVILPGSSLPAGMWGQAVLHPCSSHTRASHQSSSSLGSSLGSEASGSCRMLSPGLHMGRAWGSSCQQPDQHRVPAGPSAHLPPAAPLSSSSPFALAVPTPGALHGHGALAVLPTCPSTSGCQWGAGPPSWPLLLLLTQCGVGVWLRRMSRWWCPLCRRGLVLLAWLPEQVMLLNLFLIVAL